MRHDSPAAGAIQARPAPRVLSSTLRGGTVVRAQLGLVSMVLAGAVALTACSGSSPKPSALSSTTSIPASSVPSTGSTTTAAPTTSNLVVTNDIRSQLVAAGAALNSLSPSDYTGLRPGETYYAYDSATQTYWAGAGLLPSSTSTPAQVASQDDGAYLLFERTQGGTWQAHDVGLAGTPEGSTCPLVVPSSILTLWGWPPGSCRPATIS